jgi:glycyl-tRNA synthetase beta chain
MSSKSLLIELFVEELPPKVLQKLGDAFADDIFYSLRRLNFAEADSIKTSYASPRRLAVHITKVRDRCPDSQIRKKLVPIHLAFDLNGNMSVALQKRLEKENATLADTSRAFEDGKEFVFLERAISGALLDSSILGGVIEASISNLPIPKVMTYPDPTGDGWPTVNFVRPAHGLVALHGCDIVPVSVLGLTAGRKTKGHRFEAAVDTIELRDADSYAQQMKDEGAVIASFDERRDDIERQLASAANRENLQVIQDDALLDEVTALVERPNVLVGTFDEAFLEVPSECLILTMKANQKYFPLLELIGPSTGPRTVKLTNKFLIVSNISPADPSLVISGNERVVRPRLADAKFFYDQDRKKPLDARVLGLSRVVYHNKLGTQGERVERVQAIARSIGQQLGGDALAKLADQAALLAKADLLTDMVGEFPELQGIMGRYYAQHDGLSADVAFAIEDHYKPRFAGDELPRNMTGICVALADKLETLVGMFGIGQIPTGDRDPFALRRHALGVIRMLIDMELKLDLRDLIAISFAGFAKGLLSEAHREVETFIFERLDGVMREQGYTAQEVDAVLSLRPQRLCEVPQRLIAVKVFANMPESTALAAANKRVGNILKKVEGEVKGSVDGNLLIEIPEQSLHLALCQVSPRADAAFASGDYTASLQELAALREPVDAFFDSVMVNAEDLALRANRLALLAQLHQAMNRVADLSRLAS